MKSKTKAEAAPASGQHTPLTDRAEALPIGFYSCSTVPAVFARKLERERAGLLAALEAIAESSVQHYAMSLYPGEHKLVPVHNSDAAEHWVNAEHYTNIVEIARAAIAQAKGEK